jgi:hypothetical protein
MSLFASYLILGVGLFAAAAVLSLAIRLTRTDRLERKKSAARVETIWDAILGRTRTQHDYLPDTRIKAGLVYNKRKKRLEVSGRLSHDTFDRLFR